MHKSPGRRQILKAQYDGDASGATGAFHPSVEAEGVRL